MTQQIKILLLEDAEERTAWFQQAYSRALLDVTNDANVAIAWLQRVQYHIVFLDHDLLAEHYDDLATPEIWKRSLPKTGQDVAQWIAENKPTINTIVIHSLNVPGSNRMAQTLREASIPAMVIPFHVFKNLHADLMEGRQGYL